AVALRLMPRRLWPAMQGTDAFYHLAYVRLIREQRLRLPRCNPRVLGPGEHTYPALFHWLLAALPLAATPRADRYGGLIADLIAAAAVSLALHRLGAFDGGEAIAAAALYLLAPGLTLLHIGPRAFTLTPRPWAQTLFAIAVVLWLLDAAAAGGSIPALA